MSRIYDKQNKIKKSRRRILSIGSTISISSFGLLDKRELHQKTYSTFSIFKMETKQDIEKSKREKEIIELKNENKEYEKKLFELRQKKHVAPRDDDEIKFNEKKIFANDRQIEIKELQILAITKKQGKITAPPIFYIFRQIIF